MPEEESKAPTPADIPRRENLGNLPPSMRAPEDITQGMPDDYPGRPPETSPSSTPETPDSASTPNSDSDSENQSSPETEGVSSDTQSGTETTTSTVETTPDETEVEAGTTKLFGNEKQRLEIEHTSLERQRDEIDRQLVANEAKQTELAEIEEACEKQPALRRIFLQADSLRLFNEKPDEYKKENVLFLNTAKEDFKKQLEKMEEWGVDPRIIEAARKRALPSLRNRAEQAEKDKNTPRARKFGLAGLRQRWLGGRNKERRAVGEVSSNFREHRFKSWWAEQYNKQLDRGIDPNDPAMTPELRQVKREANRHRLQLGAAAGGAVLAAAITLGITVPMAVDQGIDKSKQGILDDSHRDEDSLIDFDQIERGRA